MSTTRASRPLVTAAVSSLLLPLLLALGARPALAVGPNPNETVTTGQGATALAQSLVGAGVAVSNATLTGYAGAAGSFAFTDPAVVGFGTGLVLSSGAATDAVGPNAGDSTSTDWAGDGTGPGDPDLTTLSGFPTYDATVLELDFVPTANQVVFQYAFASDEYSEWVDTGYNDVFAFFVNGTNCATVRQVAGDPASPFVPVAVNNINNSNPVHVPPPTPMRPDLFRDNTYNPAGPSAIDLEYDGITQVLTCQSAVTPGVTNHLKLAIADASDAIYDSTVFVQAGSLVSNENPVADLSLSTETGPAPLAVTAFVEGSDPNGLPLTYSLDWGDGTAPATGALADETTSTSHVYATSGHFTATLTVSNGTLTGTSQEDVEVTGGVSASAPEVTTDPTDQTVLAGEPYAFSAAATGVPEPTVQWQSSSDGGTTWADVPGETSTTLTGTAAVTDDGLLVHAVFTNSEGSATTADALLTVTAPDTTPPSLAPTFNTTMPFLRGATGIVASANATDASGIASESCDPVDTTAVGTRTLTCRATDNAGNSASVEVPYTVGFAVAAMSPADGASFRRTAAVPVSFQLRDALGALPDAEASALRPSVSVSFGTLPAVHPSYDKKRDLYSASLKTAKPAVGSYPVTVTVTVAGTVVAQRTVTVQVV